MLQGYILFNGILLKLYSMLGDYAQNQNQAFEMVQ